MTKIMRDSSDSTAEQSKSQTGTQQTSFFRGCSDLLRKLPLAAKSLPMVMATVVVGLVCTCIWGYYVHAHSPSPVEADAQSSWPDVDRVNRANFASVGKTPYFNLEPGYRLNYRDGSVTRTITVRRRTKIVDGVETRVVEQKQKEVGKPTRIVWKYYAIDKTTLAVYCFGVHIQTYFQGNLLSHRSWCAGVHGKHFRLEMPPQPKVGEALVHSSTRRQYEVTDLRATIVTPAGAFANCLRTEAKGSMEKVAKEKVFAPGVGLVKDGQFLLVRHGMTVPLYVPVRQPLQ
jgi:hypothetical protein